VSHDLRTPLTMIAGYSEALLDGTAGPADLEESAATIREEAGKMQRLVDDLLQLTRLEAGLQSLDRHPTPVDAYIRGIVERLRRFSPDRAERVRVDLPANLPPVDIDPDRLERALRNLIDNALEYGGQSDVTVGVRPLGADTVEIRVEDTGPGIAEEDLPRVFERFYRADRGRGREQRHSGLGLAIVHEIVDAHGGKVTVESEPGVRTAFRLALPRAIERTMEREAQPAPTLGSQAVR
jgi:two-component system sensor histidine kinase ResE